MLFSTLLAKDLGTFYNCPRLVNGASMNGSIPTLIGEVVHLFWLAIYDLMYVGHFLKETMISEDV